MAKAADLRELPDEVLLEQVESAKEELFNLRFQLATGELDNPGRLKTVRHDVARILTVLREREDERELEDSLARVEAETLEEQARTGEPGRGRLRLRRRTGGRARGGEAAAAGEDEARDESKDEEGEPS